MARKYDRYGLNRQFKLKPLTKRTPFPHKLPFVDDFSYGSLAHKIKQEKGMRPRRAGPTDHITGVKRERMELPDTIDHHNGISKVLKAEIIGMYGIGAVALAVAAGELAVPGAVAYEAATGVRMSTMAGRIAKALPRAIARTTRNVVRDFHLD